jgi:hypothetical protein
VHLLLRIALIEQQAHHQQLPDGVFLLVAVRDARMSNASCIHRQIVTIVRYDNAVSAKCIFDMKIIVRR